MKNILEKRLISKENQIMITTIKTMGLVLKILKKQDKNFSFSHIRILLVLYRHTELKIGELAKILELTPATLTTTTDHLEKQNLVKRINEKKDRRVIKVKLTNKGKIKLLKSFNKTSKILKPYFAKFSKKEKDQYLELITKLLKELENDNS